MSGENIYTMPCHLLTGLEILAAELAPGQHIDTDVSNSPCGTRQGAPNAWTCGAVGRGRCLMPGKLATA